MITKATLTELDSVVDFYKKTAQFEQTINEHILLDGVLEEGFRASLAKELLLSDFYFLFYKENDEILGFLSGYLKEKNKWWKYRQIAYIDHIFVEEKARGKGIATLLIKDFENWAKAKNADLVTIEVLPENKKAISLYEFQGYEPHMIHLKKDLE